MIDALEVNCRAEGEHTTLLVKLSIFPQCSQAVFSLPGSLRESQLLHVCTHIYCCWSFNFSRLCGRKHTMLLIGISLILMMLSTFSSVYWLFAISLHEASVQVFLLGCLSFYHPVGRISRCKCCVKYVLQYVFLFSFTKVYLDEADAGFLMNLLVYYYFFFLTHHF